MAKTRKALIKMDDYATTASTGGIVERIIITDTVLDEQTGLTDQAGNPLPKYDYVGDKTEANGYKFIPCADEVQEGWIYQDKTGALRDPNS